ncbi:hypothetical protein CMI37_06220 [Candidatus Pacearchaeota archaeon]|nr:hypothetical protein [Candidatus Pacearchaeota archaeon]|tara:strand:- start:588 stop:1478 length:891 start_codon:yes stop_codon:yes gene_type:complete
MGALTAAELALVSNDKPILCGDHVIARAAPSGTNLKWLAGDNLSGTNIVLAAYPVKRIFDKHQHIITKPNTSGVEFNLSMNLGAAYEFDMIMIGGHNFGTEGGLTVKFEKGTDATFGSTTTLSTWTPGSSDKRLVSLVLDTNGDGTALRWTEQFIRINIAGSTFTPEIGEIWVGLRRHLPYNFNQTLQEDRTRSELIRFRSRSGMTTTYTLSSGKALREGKIEIDTAAGKTAVTNWWSDTSFGSNPFLWIEEPGTSPSDCHVMTCDPELSFEDNKPTSKVLDLQMVENAPYLSGES